MTSDQWRRIEQLYEAALQRAPSERRAFLESACTGDDVLRRDVERLIAANDQAGEFLAAPAWEAAPNGLAAGLTTDDRETPLVGRQVGSYKVLDTLGVGGMGEVYRAHDSTLNRQVALKVLPEVFALHPDRLARFKREAQVLASLNHPNIGAIYGFEDADDVKALVLELVEGPTLAERIARGPLDLEETLPIARQIAEALEAAHERGIVHRDLKPANVKVRADGMVKVLDFGLARALAVHSSGDALTESPIVPSPLITADGIIVGTPAYMAPEQARGKAADKRTDLWAFGCILYEMLTGRRPFSGEDTSQTLAAVTTDEPDWRALPDGMPLPIHRLLQRCLAKDPKARAADASMARIEIDDAVASPDHDVPARWRSRRDERVAWAAALAVVAAAGVAATMWALRGALPAGEIRVEISTPPTADPLSLAISPDGQKIVFVSSTEGRSRLELRTLDSGVAIPLAGTEDASGPFWSPDSRSVAFFNQNDNTLRRADIDGRSLSVITHVPGLGFGGTWNGDDTILFASNPGLFRVSANGGEPAQVTTGPFHTIPRFLPDGRHFLFFVFQPAPAGVYVGQLDGTGVKRLLDADATPVYVSGHLLFVRQGVLLAQAFDPISLVLSGAPFRVADEVAWLSGFPAAVSASSTGTVIYRSGPVGPFFSPRQLVWFDRSGTRVGEVGDREPGWGPALSPDGRQVILARGAPPQIEVLALDRVVWTRLTTETGLVHLEPIWSPDGSRVVYSANPKGPWDLYEKPAHGAGNPELLLASPADGAGLFASDWSHDGRFVLYGTEADPKTRADIWALPIQRNPLESREQKPLAIVRTPFDESYAQFSPDGKWIAYQSNETGRFEVYLQQFPSGRKERVSASGGAQVRWRRDGKELFYIGFDDRLMSVPIDLAPNADAVTIGNPVGLFTTRVGGAVPGPSRQQYAVSGDGKRFLMNTLTDDDDTAPITMIFNWRPQPR
jgi:serine/threonine protein kinase